MGRRQYLERLALGRSAYEDVDLEQPSRPASSSTAQEVTGHEYTQQYDARGRPINPSIDHFNTEQRHAQNEVLALVGVVERKDETDRSSARNYDTIQKARQKLLTDENERGELLEHAAFASSFLLHIWPDAFRQRIQIGLYDTSKSLLDMLASEWRQPWRGGTRWFVARLLPGAASTITHHVARFALMVVAEQITGRLQTHIAKYIEKRKNMKYLELSTAWLFEGLLLAIDIALLPLEYHAATQMLGLTPALPLFPSLQFCLPWHAESFHSFGWKGVVSNRFFHKFTSPAAFFLMRKMVAYDAADSVLPVFHLITDFRFPEVDDDPAKVVAPNFKKDPIGWVLYQCYSIRSSFLQRSGWTLVKRNDIRRTQEDEYEMYTQAHSADETGSPIHRSTTLAQLPAQFLCEAIDALFAGILSLPFEALMMRTIAASFIASYTPATLLYGSTRPATLLYSSTRPATLLYTPFGGGPLSQGWAAASQYAGRIGLSLALAASVDVVLFFGIYKSVRRLGTRSLDWGRRGKIGSCIYSADFLEEDRGRHHHQDELAQVH